MVAGLLFSPVLLHTIQVPENIFSDVLDYLTIYTLGLLFQFYYNISTGIFSALGDSKTPFYFLAFSSVANIFANILFVKLGFGIKGIAWATFICQGVSCVLAFLTVLFRLRAIESGVKAPLFSKSLLFKFMKIAIPSILQQSFVSVGNMFIQSIVNSCGNIVIAGYSAVIKLQNLAVTCISTLGTAMSNYTAQNLGAGKIDRIKKACVPALSWEQLYLYCSQHAIYCFPKLLLTYPKRRQRSRGCRCRQAFSYDSFSVLCCHSRKTDCRRNSQRRRSNGALYGCNLCRSSFKSSSRIHFGCGIRRNRNMACLAYRLDNCGNYVRCFLLRRRMEKENALKSVSGVF